MRNQQKILGFLYLRNITVLRYNAYYCHFILCYYYVIIIIYIWISKNKGIYYPLKGEFFCHSIIGKNLSFQLSKGRNFSFRLNLKTPSTVSFRIVWSEHIIKIAMLQNCCLISRERSTFFGQTLIWGICGGQQFLPITRSLASDWPLRNPACRDSHKKIWRKSPIRLVHTISWQALFENSRSSL